MTDNSQGEKSRQQELRREIRKAASEFARIEFKPASADLSYHLRLRDFSDSGLGVLVKKDSELLTHLKTGDVLAMTYFKGSEAIPSQCLKVEIRHISDPAKGKPENHLIVGLHILERLDTGDAGL